MKIHSSIWYHNFYPHKKIDTVYCVLATSAYTTCGSCGRKSNCYAHCHQQSVTYTIIRFNIAGRMLFFSLTSGPKKLLLIQYALFTNAGKYGWTSGVYGLKRLAHITWQFDGYIIDISEICKAGLFVRESYIHKMKATDHSLMICIHDQRVMGLSLISCHLKLKPHIFYGVRKVWGNL